MGCGKLTKLLKKPGKGRIIPRAILPEPLVILLSRIVFFIKLILSYSVPTKKGMNIDNIRSLRGCPKEGVDYGLDSWQEPEDGAEKGKHLERQGWLSVCEIRICLCKDFFGIYADVGGLSRK